MFARNGSMGKRRLDSRRHLPRPPTRRRRDHRLQPRRTSTQRRPRDPGRFTRSRLRGAGPDPRARGRRDPARDRRVQGAGARGGFRVDRPARAVGAGVQGARGRGAVFAAAER